MSGMADHPRNQHYVPQFLLKGFGSGKRRQLYVYDKWTDNDFRTKPRNVAAEAGFYDIPVEGGVLTIEPWLSNLESEAGSRIQRLRRAGSIGELSDEDRSVIAAFIAVQHLRTNQFRSNLSHMDTRLAEILEQKGVDLSAVENYRRFEGKDEIKAFSISFLLSAAKEIIPLILQKVWILVRTTRSHPFVIGDHPIAMDNQRDFGLYGNIGFAVPGIEIYLPISSELSLYLTCPTNAQGFLEAEEKLGELKADLFDHPEVKRLDSRLSPMIAALTKGNPLPAHPQNVLRHNSLQIGYAERFVFSANQDFSLVKQMLKNNPAVRKGPRGIVD